MDTLTNLQKEYLTMHISIESETINSINLQGCNNTETHIILQFT